MGSSVAQILLATGVVTAVVIVLILNRTDVLNGARSLATVNTAWLIFAGLVTLAIWLVGTITQFGSMPGRPSVRKVFAVQVAASFANHISPAGAGGIAINVRFLQKVGLSRGAAVGSVGLNSLVGLVTHLMWLVAVVIISPAVLVSVRDQIDWSGWKSSISSVPLTSWLIAAGVIAALIALGVLLGRRSTWVRTQARRVRRMPRRLVREMKTLGAVIRHPKRAAALWLGSFSVPLLHSLILFAVLQGVGAPVDVGMVVVIYVIVSSLSTVVPGLGGVSALDVLLPWAFFTLAGVDKLDAVAAVFGYRMLTVWVPLVPGAWMFAFLIRRRII
jgi:uncharacterized protein (TIRG00374 family)